MGWVILGVVIWIVASNHSTRGCGQRRKSCRPRRRRDQSGRSASESYRRQAEREDLDRRIYMTARSITDQDEYLRHEFRNL